MSFSANMHVNVYNLVYLSAEIVNFSVISTYFRVTVRNFSFLVVNLFICVCKCKITHCSA